MMHDLRDGVSDEEFLRNVHLDLVVMERNTGGVFPLGVVRRLLAIATSDHRRRGLHVWPESLVGDGPLEAHHEMMLREDAEILKATPNVSYPLFIVRRLLATLDAARRSPSAAKQCSRTLSYSKPPGRGFLQCCLPAGHAVGHAFFHGDYAFTLDDEREGK